MAGELAALLSLADESPIAVGDGRIEQLPIAILPLRAIYSQREVARIVVEHSP